MNKYFNVILIASFLLLIFPFIGFPELWENVYVALIAFIIGYTSMVLRHKSGLVKKHDPDASLQDYVQELQEKFAKRESLSMTESKKKRLSDISFDHDEN